MNFITEEDVFKNTINYVSNVFSQLNMIGTWHETDNLPIFLQANYVFKEATLLGETYLLIFSKEKDADESVSSIDTHIQLLKKRYGINIIYIVDNITSYKRRHLIEKKINFVVPGKQLYLPVAATDFREIFQRRNTRTEEQLGPTAQAILLKFLYHDLSTEISSQEIIKILKVTKMTVSRAFNELISFKLATPINQGRNRLLKFNFQDYKLWDKAQPHLVNPVKKAVWIDKFHFQHISKMNLIESGELALSSYSMLMHPEYDTFAVYTKEWGTIKKLFNIEEQTSREKDSVRIELWRHDPCLLSNKKIVDPFSLLLSLEENDDDRIEIAKEEILKEIGRKNKWFKD
ncbi:MAG: hypothetical protein HRT37_01795 [Alteromonadaceae bacterium]|nr:hypothetical protein [Alteromonadaceae bacterium]